MTVYKKMSPRRVHVRGLPYRVTIARCLPTSIAVAALVFGPGVGAQPENAPEPSRFVNLAPDDLSFQPAPGLPGASYVVLYGDPSAAGTYVMRYRIPAGQLVPPHFHDQDRHITVIAGPWAFGTGAMPSCENTVPMPAGSYVFHPAGAVHFDGSCTDRPIEVQVIGEGPVGTFAADTQ